MTDHHSTFQIPDRKQYVLVKPAISQRCALDSVLSATLNLARRCLYSVSSRLQGLRTQTCHLVRCLLLANGFASSAVTSILSVTCEIWFWGLVMQHIYMLQDVCNISKQLHIYRKASFKQNVGLLSCCNVREVWQKSRFAS